MNTLFDAGRLQYVYVLPAVQAVLIDLRLTRPGEHQNPVVVRYRRTALDIAHDDRIAALGRRAAASGPEWAAALAECRRADESLTRGAALSMFDRPSG